MNSQLMNDWSPEYLDSMAQNWEYNTIENAPDTLRWNASDSSTLTIVQIGDSHVQGDIAASAARAFLCRLMGLPPQARGFTFPYGVAASNEPADIRSNGYHSWRPVLATKTHQPQPYGIAGAALDAYGSGGKMSITLSPERTDSSLPQSISVYYVPASNTPVPMLNGRQPTELDRGRGVATFHFDAPVTAFNLTLDKSQGNDGLFRFLGYVLRDSVSRLQYHAGGLNGADVRTVLRNVMLPYELRQLSPQIIILSLGTNDCYASSFDPEQFRAQLKELIDNIQSACPGSFIILCTPNDHLYRDREVNPRVEDCAEVIRNMAPMLGLGLWDFHRIMGGQGSILSWSNYGLTAHDCLHFSAQGYRLQGRLLAMALMRMLNPTNK